MILKHYFNIMCKCNIIIIILIMYYYDVHMQQLISYYI